MHHVITGLARNSEASKHIYILMRAHTHTFMYLLLHCSALWSCAVTGEAVFARCLSSLKEERVAASQVFPAPTSRFSGDKKAFVEDIKNVISIPYNLLT